VPVPESTSVSMGVVPPASRLRVRFLIMPDRTDS
jgi:hypothetical protein